MTKADVVIEPTDGAEDSSCSYQEDMTSERKGRTLRGPKILERFEIIDVGGPVSHPSSSHLFYCEGETAEND